MRGVTDAAKQRGRIGTRRKAEPAYTGTIHFTSSDAQATLPADYAFVAGDQGTHTFAGSIILKGAGEQWVRATDVTNTTITGEQTAITVTGGESANLGVIIGGVPGGLLVVGLAIYLWRRRKLA